jgi:proteic killer suppression protein
VSLRLRGKRFVFNTYLTITDSIDLLQELNVPPGNQLEDLKGNRKGQFSIRINQQYRICFIWTDLGPGEVEIVDYHTR